MTMLRPNGVWMNEGGWDGVSVRSSAAAMVVNFSGKWDQTRIMKGKGRV
jgi:hypothetical protein